MGGSRWHVYCKKLKGRSQTAKITGKSETISQKKTWRSAIRWLSDDIPQWLWCHMMRFWSEPRATAASNSLQFWDAIDAYLRHMAEVFSRVTSAWNFLINTCNDFVRLDACDASLQTRVNEAWNLYHCSAWKHDKTHDFSCCIRQCNYASLILGEMSFFSVMFASMLETFNGRALGWNPEASESSEDGHARLQPAETWLVTVSPRRLPFDGRKQLKRSQPEGSQVSRRLLWRFTWKSSRRFSWRFFLKVKMFQSFELVPQTCFALRPVECRMSAQLGASAWDIRRNGENRKKREATSYI